MKSKGKRVRSPRQRAIVASAFALLCVESWLIAASHAYCADALSMVLSAIELEIIVPTIGLSVAAYVIATGLVASISELKWQTVGAIAVAYAAASSVLLATVTTQDLSKAWIVGPVLGGIVGIVLIGLCVRRLPPPVTVILGIVAVGGCFAVAYSMSTFTGATACGFAP